jgi:hypothetical protein
MYNPTERVTDQIEEAFTYHPPHGDQTERYEKIRAMAHELAYLMVTECPESRELSLALTNLETAVMFANAAIARHEVESASVPLVGVEIVVNGRSKLTPKYNGDGP